jgi:uncharacterized protein YbjT (DUF2867 family)
MLYPIKNLKDISMSGPPLKLAITGANGYIGKALLARARQHGWSILALSRTPISQPDAAWMFFDLEMSSPIELPPDIDVVIHLAARTEISSKNEQQEIISAQYLLDSALKIGARFIFISSQTAQEHAPTAYGRIKWKIEQTVIHHKGWIVRPGQVYGGARQGLYGQLVDLIERCPILPSFFPAPLIQPIHVSDLVQALVTLIENKSLANDIYYLGALTPIRFSSFLKFLAAYQLHRRRYFLPVPTGVIYMLHHLLKQASSINRLVSLLQLACMNTQPSLEKLNITLCPLDFDMQRRALLLEAHALFSYIFKKRVTDLSILRRYVRMIETIKNGAPLKLPSLFLSHPHLLNLLDPKAWKNPTIGREFAWRLDAATLLAESTPQGGVRFLQCPTGKTRAFLFLIKIGISELSWHVLRFIASPWIGWSVNHAARI